MNYFLPNEKATKVFAKTCAKLITKPVLLGFQGAIGAGKTTFIRALLQAVKIKEPIKSPTFSLIESYQLHNIPIHHMDLYRIDDEESLEYLDFRAILTDAIVLIEWPEKAGKSLPTLDLLLQFQFQKEGRLLTIKANTPLGESLLASIPGTL